MKTASRRAKRLLAVLIVITVASTALGLASTLAPRLTTGDAARAAMTAAEREYFDRQFGRVQVGMDETAVREVLGEPAGPRILSELVWHGPDHQERTRPSKVIVRFSDGRVRRATWYRQSGLFSGFYCTVE